jgi:cytochrome c-type biogenesis protein
MTLTLASLGVAFLGGVLSVASPCVLPVVPVLLAQRTSDHRLRPVFVVAGLASTFIVMGVLASLAGSALSGNMRLLEKIAGGVLVFFALLMAANINPFKNIQIFNRIQVKNSGGIVSGYLVGATLGLVWIPCVGPVLSGILTMVASQASVMAGAVMLAIYSLGFAVPMLVVGYSSQLIVKRVKLIAKYPALVRWTGAFLLGALGAVLYFKGMVALVSAL